MAVESDTNQEGKRERNGKKKKERDRERKRRGKWMRVNLTGRSTQRAQKAAQTERDARR